MYKYIYTYTYIYISTHTHTHTHAPVRGRRHPRSTGPRQRTRFARSTPEGSPPAPARQFHIDNQPTCLNPLYYRDDEVDGPRALGF